MSVELTSIKEIEEQARGDGWAYECAPAFHANIHMWREMTANVEGVDPWNGLNDPFVISPRELRAIAKAHPAFADALNALAADGGAVLS